MISITPATRNDVLILVDIGYAEVEAAHRDSCAPHHLKEYLDTHYHDAAIREEILNPRHHYVVMRCYDEPIGFSKLVLNQVHPNIALEPCAKLDRIYVKQTFQGKQFGAALLQYNIDFALANQQQGLWLYTWIGNEKAIQFYRKFGFNIIGSHWFKVSETHSNENHHMLLRLGD